MIATLTKNLLRITFVAMLAVAALAFQACEADLTDGDSFHLYYPDVTDIGPSTNITISPSYHGATPSDFAISGITLDGASFESSCFSINSSTGALSLSDTDDLAVGEYAVSVSCVSDGKTYNFKDIVIINMMNAVPDGITVEPSVLNVSLGDVLDEDAELPTAQITTDGNHISIERYLISSVTLDGTSISNYSDYFEVSDEGEVSIIQGETDMDPGQYVLSFKLTTYVVDESSSEGIFSDALTVNVTSEPISLTYSPNPGQVETGYSFTSLAPVLVGSTDGLSYEFKSYSPSDCPASIDASTGVISIDSSHSMEIGTICTFSVTVTNSYGSTDFDDVLTVEVVDYIPPITVFSYDDVGEVIQLCSFSNSVKEMDGGSVTYAFVDLAEGLSGLSIDVSTGEVSLETGVSVEVGTYTVTVEATNTKGSMQASFSLTIVENPYIFSYVCWGNNLDLSPAKDYASQYRVTDATSLQSLELPIVDTDIPDDVPVTFTILGSSYYISGNGATIDENGTIVTSGMSFPSTPRVIMFTVQVVVGEGEAAQSKNIPVFFHCAYALDSGIEINYTPFVFQVNPSKGGTSVTPDVTGVSDMSLFVMDYRRTFTYVNLNGPDEHIAGAPGDGSTTFLYSMWSKYFTALGSSINTGSRNPVSYYANSSNLSAALLYVDNDNGCCIVVNQNMFRNDYGYANGVFSGQITFAVDGADPQSAATAYRYFPILVWFDTDF